MPRTYLAESVYIRYLGEDLEFSTMTACHFENEIELTPSMVAQLCGYVRVEQRNLYSERVHITRSTTKQGGVGAVYAELENEGTLVLTLERGADVEATVIISPGIWTAAKKYMDRESKTVVHKKAGTRQDRR